ncbi:Amino acid/polyamine transporter I [Cinara cedri]|uniref:b(0,+)-type amino acid transporter 1 n=1 Tax=Cinara cedri TaxID=506608 RepID=A0A5E4N4C9_9HEMI|nr:Amino acid/polyamine transporter I [Cinara cedri]
MKPKPQTHVKLQRELGLFSASCLLVNLMLGSGIFISSANTLQNTGSVGMNLVLWTCCGMLSLMGAMSYAELGTMVNKSGSEFGFYLYAFGDLNKFWGPLPSFVYSWVTIVYINPAAMGIVALTFAEYTVRPFGLRTNEESTAAYSPEVEHMLKKAVALAAICVITFINYISVKVFVKIQNVLTISKVTVCIVIIVAGLYQIYLGKIQTLMTGFEGTKLSIDSLSMAFYSGLWGFGGWTAVTDVFEEIKNPERNILLSILLTIPFVTLIYVLINISYLTVLSIPEMISVPAVAVEFGIRALGIFGFVIPIGVVTATFGCALSIQFKTARLCFAASREGQFLEVFSYVSVKNLTPAPAVFLQGLLASVCILSGNIISLIEFVGFLAWMFFGISMVALLKMRCTQKDIYRPFKVPIVIPVLVLVASIVLFLTPLIQSPKPQFLIALALILSAFAVYVPFVYHKKRWSFVDNFTRAIEKLMGVVKPDTDETELA